MFYGEFEHTLDRKGRLILPAKLREVFRENYIEKFFITRGLDKCLFLFAEDEWKLQEQKFKAISFTNAEARRFNRLYFSGASEVTCDRQGRLLIPRNLKDFASIKKEVVIVGVSDRIEIWNKSEWQEFYRNNRESFEEIAERIIGEKDGAL